MSFAKVQVYCKANNCCFDDIKNSRKPFIIINMDEISSIEPQVDWGFCEGHSKYPFRKLKMHNGDAFLCVLDSVNELEKKLLKEE